MTPWLSILIASAGGLWAIWHFWSMGPFSLLMGVAVFLALVFATTVSE